MKKKCKEENEVNEVKLLELKEENQLLRNELIQNEMKHKDEIIKLQKKLLSIGFYTHTHIKYN